MNSIIFWNCRGSKKREATLYLKEIIKDHKVFFVGLIETKVSSMDKESFTRMMGQDWDFFLLPSAGLSGGIMVKWRSDLASFSVVKTSEQCVMGELNVFNRGVWMITTVYASKETLRRRCLWDLVQGAAQSNIPSIIGGDFNYILYKEDKKEGRRFKFNQGSLEMVKFMNENDYHEVGFVGPRFTWCNNKKGGERILERLDRCLLNSMAINKIQITLVRHLARVASDHCPIALKVFETACKGRSGFKFEDTWLSFKAAEHIVANRWRKTVLGDDMEILNKKCKRTLKDLFYWSNTRLKEFSLEKDILKAEIVKLQEEESEFGWLTEEKLWLLKVKVKELNLVLNNLNTWWKQRAKAKWINEVKDSNGILTEDMKEIEEVFRRFFQEKWKYRNCSFSGWPEPRKVLDDCDSELLIKDLEEAEIKEIIFNLGNNKSLGFDGITHSFFKAFWNTIRMDVVNAVKQFFVTGLINKEWKDPLIVLIPKSPNPSTPSAYRPISLCNTIYKIAAKVLLNRMLGIIPKIISEEQAAFVRGRAISDHLLLAQEAFNKMRLSKACNGFLAIKVGMEQEYDSMCWSTLEKMMLDSGFPSRFVHLVLECVTTPRSNKRINAWGNKFISLAGRLVLIKSVALSLPLFVMTHSLIPMKILLEFEKMCRDFIWNKVDGNRGIHYVSWEQLCKPKQFGGWDVHSVVDRKDAMKAKIAWKLIDKPDSFLSRHLIAKYGVKWWSYGLSRNSSSTWKLMSSGWKALKDHVRWRIGNGCKIKVLKDTWILDKPLLKWPKFVGYFEDEDASLDGFISDGCWDRGKLGRFFRTDLVALICENLGRSKNWVIYQSSGLSSYEWQRPPPDWIKTNFDASLKGNYEAGIGGIARDYKGRFLLAFGIKKMHWDIAQLELSGASAITEIIRDRFDDIGGIIVEGDNKNVIKFLHNLHSTPKKLDRRLDLEDSSFLNKMETDSSSRAFIDPRFIEATDQAAYLQYKTIRITLSRTVNP
ncbi:hypothetical protein KFK09_007073 [Dendrobium nobile]|uniref:Endonuclease/exonuclease/phosphatase domain-containing protein n=1 Tax=Dendrobium nobile TaxID=94219 RepID=A0A8T3BTB6_DENNO|nr:hypothetical protein KFK09_007073 [Dendrobium nobile]